MEEIVHKLTVGRQTETKVKKIQKEIDLLKAFDTYFQPDKNVIYEHYLFGSANQEPQENIEQYEGGYVI